MTSSLVGSEMCIRDSVWMVSSDGGPDTDEFAPGAPSAYVEEVYENQEHTINNNLRQNHSNNHHLRFNQSWIQ
eukprot:6601659-Prorocentrum_lima.AAC.1